MSDTKLLRIDADLHRLVKAAAAVSGMSLKAFVEEALRVHVDDTNLNWSNTPRTAR